MKKVLLVLFLVIGLSSLFGIVTVQTVSFNTFVNGTIGPFNEWSSPGYTLTNVNVELYVTSNNGMVIADNDDQYVNATITYTLGTSADLSTNAAGPTLLINGDFDIWQAEATASATGYGLPVGPVASDWVTGDYSPAAPDGMQYSGSAENDTKAADIGPTYRSEYEGTGTYYFDIITQAITNVTFTAGSGEQSAQSADITGYVKVTYTDDNPVPVTLSSFTAMYLDGAAQLQWTTQSETSNLGWNVYRSTVGNVDNATQINPILIPGSGSVTEPTYYTFNDETETLPGNTYYYWIEDVTYGSVTTLHGPVSVQITEEGTSPSAPAVADQVMIHNYPNPFNPATSLFYNLKDGETATRIDIYNMRGQIIKTFDSPSNPQQWDSTDMNGEVVSSGIYLYILKTNQDSYVKKMVLSK